MQVLSWVPRDPNPGYRGQGGQRTPLVKGQGGQRTPLVKGDS